MNITLARAASRSLSVEICAVEDGVEALSDIGISGALVPEILSMYAVEAGDCNKLVSVQECHNGGILEAILLCKESMINLPSRSPPPQPLYSYHLWSSNSQICIALFRYQISI